MPRFIEMNCSNDGLSLADTDGLCNDVFNMITENDCKVHHISSRRDKARTRMKHVSGQENTPGFCSQ